MARPLKAAGKGSSTLWEAMNGRPAPAAVLSGTHETDIAIVGGGVSGLSLALHLAAEGQSPIVLEALHEGSGAAGTSAGIIAPQLIRQTPKAIEKRLGPTRGRAYLSLLAEAGRFTFDLIAQQGMVCDASQRGLLAPVTGESGVRRVAEIAEQWSELRADVLVLNEERTRGLTGCRGYSAAILDRSGGGIDPLAFARGLSARASAAGARVFCKSPAVALEKVGAGWRIRTDGGEVLARRVVLCANGGNDGLHPALSGTILPLPVYEVATAPLSEEARAGLLPQGQCLTDMEADVFSVRFAHGNRLITAYPASPNITHEQIEAGVNDRLSKMLMHHTPVRLEHIWLGTAWINSSLLPRLTKVDEGLIAVQACNGRGLALNTIIGRQLARVLTSGVEDTALPLEQPKRISGYFFAKHAPRLLLSAALLSKRVRSAFTSLQP